MWSTKIVAMATALCFFYCAIAVPIIEAVVTPLPPRPDVQVENDTLLLPPSIGRITAGRDFHSGVMVINIQDLHCHPEVQRNISKILEILDKKHPLQTVYIEGGYGDIDTSWLADLPIKKAKEEVAGALMRSGRLTGSEYFSITHNRPNLLKGLEDEKLHRENIIRLGHLLEKKELFDKTVLAMDEEAAFLKIKYLNRKNRKLNDLIERHKQGTITTEKFYRLLEKYVEIINAHPADYNARFNIDLTSYPNISTYLAMLDTTRRLDQNRISKQLRSLLEELKSVLPYSQYRVLLQETDNLSTTEKLYESLTPILHEYQRKLHCYPELTLFLDYIAKSRSINPIELIEEEKQLIMELRISLSETVSEAETSFLLDCYPCFRDYLFSKITPDDYRYFSTRFAKFCSLWEKYTCDHQLKTLEPEFAVLDKFYGVNLQRNSSFLKRIVANHPSGIVITITGGFHSQGLQELFEERQISYLTITPSVTGNAETAGTNYRAIVSEQAKIFASQALAPNVFSEMMAPVMQKTRDGGFVLRFKTGESVKIDRNGIRAITAEFAKTIQPAPFLQKISAVLKIGSWEAAKTVKCQIKLMKTMISPVDLIPEIYYAFISIAYLSARQGWLDGNGLAWNIDKKGMINDIIIDLAEEIDPRASQLYFEQFSQPVQMTVLEHVRRIIKMENTPEVVRAVDDLYRLLLALYPLFESKKSDTPFVESPAINSRIHPEVSAGVIKTSTFNDYLRLKYYDTGLNRQQSYKKDSWYKKLWINTAVRIWASWVYAPRAEYTDISNIYSISPLKKEYWHTIFEFFSGHYIKPETALGWTKAIIFLPITLSQSLVRIAGLAVMAALWYPIYLLSLQLTFLKGSLKPIIFAPPMSKSRPGAVENLQDAKIKIPGHLLKKNVTQLIEEAGLGYLVKMHGYGPWVALLQNPEAGVIFKDDISQLKEKYGKDLELYWPEIADISFSSMHSSYMLMRLLPDILKTINEDEKRVILKQTARLAEASGDRDIILLNRAIPKLMEKYGNRFAQLWPLFVSLGIKAEDKTVDLFIALASIVELIKTDDDLTRAGDILLPYLKKAGRNSGKFAESFYASGPLIANFDDMRLIASVIDLYINGGLAKKVKDLPAADRDTVKEALWRMIERREFFNFIDAQPDFVNSVALFDKKIPPGMTPLSEVMKRRAITDDNEFQFKTVTEADLLKEFSDAGFPDIKEWLRKKLDRSGYKTWGIKKVIMPGTGLLRTVYQGGALETEHVRYVTWVVHIAARYARRSEKEGASAFVHAIDYGLLLDKKYELDKTVSDAIVFAEDAPSYSIKFTVQTAGKQTFDIIQEMMSKRLKEEKFKKKLLELLNGISKVDGKDQAQVLNKILKTLRKTVIAERTKAYFAGDYFAYVYNELIDVVDDFIAQNPQADSNYVSNRISKTRAFSLIREEYNARKGTFEDWDAEAFENIGKKLDKEKIRSVLSKSVDNFLPKELIEELKKDPYLNTYFPQSVGVWEGYVLEKHIAMVLGQFERYFARRKLPGNIDTGLFRLILALHDAGKPQAVVEGDRDKQYEYSKIVVRNVLTELGYSENDIRIAEALIMHDDLGLYLRGRLTKTKAVENINKLVEYSGMDASDFINLLTIFYMCDAGSYTGDAGGKAFLDSRFIFHHKTGKMGFAKDYRNKLDSLKEEFEKATQKKGVPGMVNEEIFLPTLPQIERAIKDWGLEYIQTCIKDDKYEEFYARRGEFFIFAQQLDVFLAKKASVKLLNLQKMRESLADVFGVYKIMALNKGDNETLSLIDTLMQPLFPLLGHEITYDKLIDFLTDAKTKLEKAKKKDKKDSPSIVFVMGPEAPDLDAISSSIFEAYRNTLIYGDDVLFIPVIQGSTLPDKAKLVYGKEFSDLLLFTKTRSGKDTPAYVKVAKKNSTRWILTDFNSMPGSFKDRVLGIIDHHKEDPETVKLPFPKTIYDTGSTMAIVFQKLCGSGILLDTGFDKRVARIVYGTVLASTDKHSLENIRDFNDAVMNVMQKMTETSDILEPTSPPAQRSKEDIAKDVPATTAILPQNVGRYLKTRFSGMPQWKALLKIVAIPELPMIMLHPFAFNQYHGASNRGRTIFIGAAWAASWSGVAGLVVSLSLGQIVFGVVALIVGITASIAGHIFYDSKTALPLELFVSDNEKAFAGDQKLVDATKNGRIAVKILSKTDFIHPPDNSGLVMRNGKPVWMTVDEQGVLSLYIDAHGDNLWNEAKDIITEITGYANLKGNKKNIEAMTGKKVDVSKAVVFDYVNDGKEKEGLYNTMVLPGRVSSYSYGTIMNVAQAHGIATTPKIAVERSWTQRLLRIKNGSVHLSATELKKAGANNVRLLQNRGTEVVAVYEGTDEKEADDLITTYDVAGMVLTNENAPAEKIAKAHPKTFIAARNPGESKIVRPYIEITDFLSGAVIRPDTVIKVHARKNGYTKEQIDTLNQMPSSVTLVFEDTEFRPNTLARDPTELNGVYLLLSLLHPAEDQRKFAYALEMGVFDPAFEQYIAKIEEGHDVALKSDPDFIQAVRLHLETIEENAKTDFLTAIKERLQARKALANGKERQTTRDIDVEIEMAYGTMLARYPAGAGTPDNNNIATFERLTGSMTASEMSALLRKEVIELEHAVDNDNQVAAAMGAATAMLLIERYALEKSAPKIDNRATAPVETQSIKALLEAG
ncbi:MAG: hypothetical protein ABSH12_04815 [Endomicrobiales bacterium]